MIYTQSIFLAYILFEIISHGEASLNYQHLIVFAVIACIELVIKKSTKSLIRWKQLPCFQGSFF